jgi:hypothetical protein
MVDGVKKNRVKRKGIQVSRDALIRFMDSAQPGMGCLTASALLELYLKDESLASLVEEGLPVRDRSPIQVDGDVYDRFVMAAPQGKAGAIASILLDLFAANANGIRQKVSKEVGPLVIKAED